MKKLLLGLTVIGTLFSACQKDTQNIKNDDLSSTDQIVPGQYVVVLKKTGTKLLDSYSYAKRVQIVKEDAKQMVAQHNISTDAVQLAYGTALRGFSAKLSEQELITLKNDNRIDYILPDRIFTLGQMEIKKGKPGSGGGGSTIQTIPFGITRVGYGNGAGKTAWIIDTGIDFNHPDLNVDVSRAANFTRARSADDDNGHGSHCAGTIAALNNNIGVVGVAAGANVVPVKVLDRKGSGQYSWIIAGIDYVAANANQGDAANMSLGGSPYQPIDDAVINLASKEVFVALAAGNESDDANNHSPARANAANIWTVSAMDDQDVFAYFSNYGNPPVDYCMPGVNVYSTYKKGGYATMSGTSMASPHMCGVLLMTNGNPKTDGYVNADPDGNPDPIGHL